jgi:AraC-like DNA-binding protein
MSEPSNWPLSKQAVRTMAPMHLVERLRSHPLSSDIYTTAVGYYPSANRHEMVRVAHDDYILLYCAGGKGHLVTDSYQGQINRGELFILPPGERHRYEADSSEPWTLFWCHFRGELAPSYFEHFYQHDSALVIEAHDIHVLASFREMVQLARHSFTVEAFIHVGSVLKQLLTSIERIASDRHKRRMGIDLVAIQAYMHQNINKPITLQELSELSRLTKYHFSRRYHELTGFAPLQHFIYLKVEHSCYLLEQTKLSISDIAYQLGYDDALYFSRVFKKQMKLSPSQYRKSLLAVD